MVSSHCIILGIHHNWLAGECVEGVEHCACVYVSVCVKYMSVYVSVFLHMCMYAYSV